MANIGNVGMIDFVFHKETDSTINGAELSVQAGYNTVNLEISGTATNFTAIVEGRATDNGEFYPIQVANLSTLELGSEITEKGLYQMDLSALIKCRIRVTSIASGNLSVFGRVVS